MSKTKMLSFRILTDKETMVTEFNYVSLPNYDLRNVVTRFFNSLKHHKQIYALPKVWFL
jgi:hypothetical protein